MRTAYNITSDVKFGFLKLIDIERVAAAVKDEWSNQTLCEVNDCVVRLGVVKGEFHWHKHDAEDEFFYVVDGKFFIDLQDRTIELGPRQAFAVPKGTMHRTRAPVRTTILMIEGRTVTATGDE